LTGPAHHPVFSEWERHSPQLRALKTGKREIAIELPNPRRLALSVVLGQAAVTLICALVSFGVADARAAMSALLGGGISSVASLAMALIGFGKQAMTDPQRAIRAFFVGEAAKVVVVIVLFIVVLKTMKVVPLAMLGSYIATFFVFWAALANALPPLGRLSKES
jgi:ATP synthase protein I